MSLDTNAIRERYCLIPKMNYYAPDVMETMRKLCMEVDELRYRIEGSSDKCLEKLQRENESLRTCLKTRQERIWSLGERIADLEDELRASKSQGAV